MAFYEDVVRLTVVGRFSGMPWVNVFHFATVDQSPVDQDHLEGVVTSFADVAAASKSFAHVLNNMDTGCHTETFTGMTAYSATPAEFTTTVDRAGNSAGADEPGLLAVNVRWRTALATRNFRGHTWYSGVNQGMLGADKDFLDPDFAAAMQSDVDDFVDIWSGSGINNMAPVIFSRKLAHDAAALASQRITSGTVRPMIGTQRRRRG